MGDRWDRRDKWNLREGNSDTGEKILPKLSILRERDDVVESVLTYFGNDCGENPTITRAVPVKKTTTESTRG